MKFKKVTELVNGKLLVYFLDKKGNIHGELLAYCVTDPVLIREENLIYVQEYSNGNLINERVFK